MKNQSKQIHREHLLRLISGVLLIVLLLAILMTIENLLISFILAFASTYILSPFVKRLERSGLGHRLSVAIPFVSLLILGTAIIAITVPLILEQVQELRLDLPQYIESSSHLVHRWEKLLKDYFPYAVKLNFADSLGGYLESFLTNIIQIAPKLAQQLLTVCLLSPLFAYFMLKDGPSVSKKILSIFPNNVFEMALGLSHKINSQLGDFIRARLLESIIVGAVIWIGLALLQFRYALFLSLFAATMNLIPYLGPFIGAMPALLLAFISPDPTVGLFLVALVYLIAQLIDIIFIIPLIVARTVDLHPITVIVSFIIGAHLMGVMGMIICIPAVSILKLICTTLFNQLIKFRA